MLRNVLLCVSLIERSISALLAVLVACALLIVFGQFVDRHFIDLPWDAPDQFARIVIIWLCFMGTAAALSEGSAIRIDLLDHIMPRAVLIWRDTVFDLVLLALLAVIAVKGWEVVKIGASQILLGTPFTADVTYSGLFAGAVTGILLTIGRLLRRARGTLDSHQSGN